LSKLVLTESYTKQVVGDTSAKEERRGQSGQRGGYGGKDLDEGVWGYTGVEAGRVVVE
jgi:hypothetical protein